MTEGLLLYAASDTCADAFAASRYLAGDPFSYIEVHGRRLIAVTGFEVRQAAAASGADEVWSFEELGLLELLQEGVPRREADAEIVLRAVRRAGLDGVVVPGWFPVATADALRAAGIALRVDDAVVSERRRRKTALEVEAIRAAQRATERSLEVARALVFGAAVRGDGELEVDGEPLTSERVQAAIRGSWVADGAEGELPIVAGGPRSADPHDAGSGPLCAGEPIILDLFPRLVRERFHADLTRTFCVGEPPAELVELHRAVLHALEVGLAAVGPGVPGAEVNRRVADALRDLGYASLLHEPEGSERRARMSHSLGHGVGLAVHEEPSLGSSGRHPLEPGEVVTVEPGLYRHGFGGVRLEDLVVVTEDGCENLTRSPYALS
jgi:Xaa-Pro aminopeptidase